MDSIEFHRYLALRLRLAGERSTHSAYFVNILTESAFSTDLWQHRLYFKHNNNRWEDIFVRGSSANHDANVFLSMLFHVSQIPFNNFVRVNAGQIVESKSKIHEQILSVGVALLGGHCNATGKYELGIDTIRIVNEEDVTVNPGSLSQSAGLRDCC
jgi:NADH dehydrogenase [ubiquinone] 1 alpha subcomplex assembly factor 1